MPTEPGAQAARLSTVVKRDSVHRPPPCRLALVERSSALSQKACDARRTMRAIGLRSWRVRRDWPTRRLAELRLASASTVAAAQQPTRACERAAPSDSGPGRAGLFDGSAGDSSSTPRSSAALRSLSSLTRSRHLPEEALATLVRGIIRHHNLDTTRRLRRSFEALLNVRPSRRLDLERARARTLAELICVSAATREQVDEQFEVPIHREAFRSKALHSLSDSGLVRLAWASSTFSPAKLLAPILAPSPGTSPTGDRQQSAAKASAHGAAASQAPGSPLVNMVASALLARAQRLDLRQLARATWALAKADQALQHAAAVGSAPAAPRAGGGAALNHLGVDAHVADQPGRASEPQPESDVRAALAGLCARAAELAPAKLHEVDGRELGILAWAGARAACGRHATPDAALASRALRQSLLDPIAEEATRRRPSSLPLSEHALIAWALARAEGWALTEGVAMPSGEPEPALARSRQIEADFFAALGARAADVRADATAGKLNRGLLSSLLWSLATAGHQPADLIAECARALAREAAQLAVHDQVQLAWALASLGACPADLMSPIVRTLNGLLPPHAPASPQHGSDGRGTPQRWAAELTAKLAGNVAGSREAIARAAAPHASMLHTARLALELEHREQPLRLRRELTDVWLDSIEPTACGGTFPSVLHARVVRALERRSVGHVCELLVPERGHRVDIALSQRTPTVIDVLGPTHFRFGTVPKLSTIVKHRHLRAAGWRVLCVPWWEWPPADDGAPEGVRAEEENYVRRLLSRQSETAESGCR